MNLLMNLPVMLIFAIIEFSHLSTFVSCFHYFSSYLLLLMLKRTPDLLKDWDIIWNEKFREC